MVGKINSTMTVAQRHAGHIPENEHEPPLLIIHIPGRYNAFFALAASVRIKKVRQQQEAYFATHIPKVFVLSRRRSQ